MANVVITDTDKTGWIKIEYNAYYPTSCTHKTLTERKESITAVDIIAVGGEECVEVMGGQDFSEFYTHDNTSNRFFIVDTINGVAPTSISDLRTKLLALL